MSHVQVIAEVGSTHRSITQQMFDCINTASDAGADVVKFQWLSSGKKLAAMRGAETYRKSYQLLEFPLHVHGALRNHCHDLGMRYACSVYLVEDIPVVVKEADIIKVSSFEAGVLPFVLQVLFAAKTENKPVIISLGGRDQETTLKIYYEIRQRFSSFTEYWPKISFLHCLSAYPTHRQDMQLHCLSTVKAFNAPGSLQIPVFAGLSDHTTSTMVGAFAVTASARIIEKHVRHQHTLRSNADFAVSLSPAKFKQYVRYIRMAEEAYGEVKLPRYVTEQESKFLPYQQPLNFQATV